MSYVRPIAVVFALVTLFCAQEAGADLPPPEENLACDGKKAGDACTTASVAAGRCVADTCSRLDYSQGTPPSTVSYECQRCAPASEAPASEPPAAAKGCSIAADGASSLALLALGFTALRRRRAAGAPRL